MSRPTMIFASNYGPEVDPSRWVVIYPPYIDSLRKEKEVSQFQPDGCRQLPVRVAEY